MRRLRQITRRQALASGGASVAMTLAPGALSAADGPRVLHIDSYHRGNEWNDRIADALVATFDDAGVAVSVFHMDTKRRSTEADKQAAAAEAVALIRDMVPDLVTTSDDNAVKYVLMPHFRDAALPFVFCGVNWDASVYGLPYANATGMVEVAPIPQILQLLQPYASGVRVGFLAEDTPTKHKEKAHHERLFKIGYSQCYFVSDFAGWADAYRRAQTEVDMLMLLGVGAVGDWDDEAARRLAETETRIPAGTDFGWLAPYALLGVAKLPEEQGIWAANAGLRILASTAPSAIPLSYNTEGALLFNPRVAERLGIDAVPPLARLVD